MHLLIPRDYQQTLWWRRLAEQLGSRVTASHVVLSLWCELGYLAVAGQLPGRLTLSDATRFMNELGRDGVAAGELLTRLCAATLLVEVRDADGRPEHYECPTFAGTYGGAANHRSISARGGQSRSYTYAAKAAERQAVEATLLLDPAVLVDESRAPLSPEWIRRVQRFIALLDSALAQPPRPVHAYLATTIQNALPPLRKYTDEQLQVICRKLYLKRTHPALAGMVTERLLPRFEELASAAGALEVV